MPKRNAAPMLVAFSMMMLVSSTGFSNLIQIDTEELVSRADITHTKPVARSEEGLPVGNGRMGSLVWATPTALRLQINRVDVLASNCATNSFPERHSDYCGGCGFVDIDFVDYGEDVFGSEQTQQHLSCYAGLVTVTGRGVDTQCVAWPERDVLAIEVSDQRRRPTPISVSLRMLRPAIVTRRSHSALSRLEKRDDRIILIQRFAEADYFCGSVISSGCQIKS